MGGSGVNPYSSVGNGSSNGNIVGLETARVVTAPSHEDGDGGCHAVEVTPEMMDESVIADVRVGQVGDVAIPSEGSKVIIGYRVNGRPIVLGQRYSENDDIPDYESGERVIGHPLSDARVRLASDGTVHVEGDGEVVVNGGSARPVTDVSASTDSDGNVTDISLTRADGVYLPSQGD